MGILIGLCFSPASTYEEHWGKPQLAQCTDAQHCFALVQSRFQRLSVKFSLLITTGCLQFPLPPPLPTWKGLANPNLTAILLLKLSMLIILFITVPYDSHPFKQEIKPRTLKHNLKKLPDRSFKEPAFGLIDFLQLLFVFSFHFLPLSFPFFSLFWIQFAPLFQILRVEIGHTDN